MSILVLFSFTSSFSLFSSSSLYSIPISLEMKSKWSQLLRVNLYSFSSCLLLIHFIIFSLSPFYSSLQYPFLLNNEIQRKSISYLLTCILVSYCLLFIHFIIFSLFLVLFISSISICLKKYNKKKVNYYLLTCILSLLVFF